MEDEDDMFRPPINRAMRVLDRSFFIRDVPIAAAGVADIKSLSRIRGDLVKSRDILALRQTFPIQPDPGAAGSRRCILLRSEIKHDGEKTMARARATGQRLMVIWQINRLGERR